MKCPYCHQEIISAAKYCPYCGKPVQQSQSAQESQSVQQSQPAQHTQKIQSAQSQQHTEQRIVSGGTQARPHGSGKKHAGRKKTGSKFVLIILVVAGVLAAAWFLLGRRSGLILNSVDLSECIKTPQFSGLDGEGEIDNNSIQWDEVAVKAAIEKAVGEESTDLNIEDLESNFTLTPDKTNGLSNGDTVTISINYANKEYFEDEYNVHFTGSTKQFKVTTLTEIREADPFDGLVPSFDGVAPQATISIDTDALNKTRAVKEGLDWISDDGGSSYTIYKNGEELGDNYVDIGDVLEIEINDTGIERWKEHGYKPSRTSVKYEVTTDDVNSYVLHYKDLSQDIVSQLHDMFDDNVTAVRAQGNETGQAEYLGSFFMVPKETGWENGNIPFLTAVYSYSNSENDETTYYVISVSGIQSEKTAESAEAIQSESAEEVASSSESQKDSNQFYNNDNVGDVEEYYDKASVYNGVVNSNLDNYELEYSDGLEDFAENVE